MVESVLPLHDSPLAAGLGKAGFLWVTLSKVKFAGGYYAWGNGIAQKKQNIKSTLAVRLEQAHGAICPNTGMILHQLQVSAQAGPRG